MPKGEWREAIKVAEAMSTDTLESLMPHFTEFSPNAYTYSKSLAEQICVKYQHQIPIIIVRPSIVVGTEREPFGGW